MTTVAITSETINIGGCGVGLRLPHLNEVLARRPRVDWLEVHPENFVANAHAAEILEEIAGSYPVAFHTVGLSIGSAGGVDRAHLHRVRRLADSIRPVLVSGHLAWSTWKGVFLNDLLPLPYTSEALEGVARAVSEVQDALGQRYLVENPASYLAFECSSLTETDFLNELAARTGCGLLCDISNVAVSAHNLNFDPVEYLSALDPAAVGELHLGGHRAEPDTAVPGRELLIDTHAESISDGSWDLYRHAVRLFPEAPTLVEWDNELPDFDVLAAEAGRANANRNRIVERCNGVAR